MRRLWILLLLAGCSQREQPITRPPIILISVDTLRSDHLPAYGYRGVATPHIDALRCDAVLYRRAYSHCPMTLPSHASMLTGLLPTEHGVRNNVGYRLGPQYETLAETLRGAGYRTGGAVSSYVLRSETGIADGFDVYDDEVNVTAGAATSENQRSGFETLKAAQKFVIENAAAPFFLFFHIYEPHAPYEPSYDGEIAKSDAILGQLMATLKQAGVYDRALIVFTSDHGEALWEHGEDQHGILLYREVLQVPLLIKHPGNDPRANTSVAAPFALRNVFDEMIFAAGLPARRDTKVYSETFYPRIHLGWSELRSLIDGRWHYIESSSPELYDLERDPAETKNVLAEQRRVAAAMRRELAAIPSELAPLGPVDEEEVKKLAALGYLGTPQQRSGPLPNPREQIHTLRDVKAAFQLASERRYDEAVAALRKLLEANPGATDVATRLAEVLVETGRASEAVDVYRDVVARTQRITPELALGIAVAHARSGNGKDAVAHAELAIDESPYEAHDVLARVAIEEGRFADADRHVRKAIGASRRQPKALLLAAELQRVAGDYAGALQTLDATERRANELGMKLQGIDHMRGDVLARMDRPEEAVAAYRRELATFPQHLQSYANLAIIHFIQGREGEGERLLEEMVRLNPHRGARELAKRTREAF